LFNEESEMNEMIVSFANNSVKERYKRKETKKHSWLSKYYAVLHVASYSESSIAHVMLCNDAGEIWFVDTRDLRVENKEEFHWNK